MADHDPPYRPASCPPYELCLYRKGIDISAVLTGQRESKKPTRKFVSPAFMEYDFGYFDDETCRAGPLANPLGAKVIPVSSDDCVAFLAYKADEHAFIDSQRRSLSAHLDGLLVFNIITAGSVFLAAQKVG